MTPGSASRRKGVPRGERVAASEDWRDPVLERLRSVILEADPGAIEEVKWRKPSNPDGVPVWSDGGMICVGNVLKNAVRLTFPKGALIKDPKRLFNTRLDSKTVRAVDVFEGSPINEAGLRAIVREAVRLNRAKSSGK